MLDKPVDEIIYGSDGRVTGVRSGDEVIIILSKIVLYLPFSVTNLLIDCENETSHW